MKPFDMFCSIHVRTSVSSESNIEYISPIGGFFSVINGITWSTDR